MTKPESLIPEACLLPELLTRQAAILPQAKALIDGDRQRSYAELAQEVASCAAFFMSLGQARGARIAVFLEKRIEAVVACFAAAQAGCVFVPINPALRPAQVRHILADSGASLLVSSLPRLQLLQPHLQTEPDEGSGLASLQAVLTVDEGEVPALLAGVRHCAWSDALAAPPAAGHRVIDQDLAAIIYTSGSTGLAKGVMLSHRNMVSGAASVAAYLENRADDVLLAALPLSFDAGFSQLTTGFLCGACVVLMNPLRPRDVLDAMATHRITGLTAVPPLYIQLAQLEWPAAASEHLRYFANTGGRMPQATLALLRQRMPRARPFLMYGLTEAFRSTYLPPEEVDRRPDSIGQAIPNAEILVLREDGSPCAVDEPGELVHRGALVGLGYWNDPEKTAERFKPLPESLTGRPPGLQLPEYAVFSGDTVRRDAQGFLYFIGRRDEMIKTSGYRVSPNEVEELLYASGLVGECVAFGVEHESLGQVIQVIATAPAGAAALDLPALLGECRRRMPAYMLPAGIEQQAGPLPRNPNGKIDRKLLASAWLERRRAP